MPQKSKEIRELEVTIKEVLEVIGTPGSTLVDKTVAIDKLIKALEESPDES